jgi:hypothetical protein
MNNFGSKTASIIGAEQWWLVTHYGEGAGKKLLFYVMVFHIHWHLRLCFLFEILPSFNAHLE